MPTQIEHIDLYSAVKEHRFENLVLLCLGCHGEVTSGRLSKLDVRRSREKPYSQISDLTTYRPILGKQFEVNLGNVGFTCAVGNSFSPFSVTGIKPLTVSILNKIVVNLNLFDRMGQTAVSIVENVFQFTPSKLWDVRLTGTSLKVSYGMCNRVLDAEISNSAINFRTIRFAVNRVPIIVDKTGIHFPNGGPSFSRCNFDAAGVPGMTFFSIGDSIEKSLLNLVYTPSLSDRDAWDLALKKRR